MDHLQENTCKLCERDSEDEDVTAGLASETASRASYRNYSTNVLLTVCCILLLAMIVTAVLIVLHKFLHIFYTDFIVYCVAKGS